MNILDRIFGKKEKEPEPDVCSRGGEHRWVTDSGHGASGETECGKCGLLK